MLDLDAPEAATETASPRRVAARVEAALPHHLTLVLFTFLWGSNFVLAQVALREMTPLAFSVARFVMGAAGLIVMLYYECRREARLRGDAIRLLPRIEGREWPRLLLVAVFGATFAPWLGIEGLHLTYATRAAFWLALAPVASALFGFLMQTERITRLGGIGLLVAGLGTVGLAVDGLQPERGFWFGDLLLVAALVFAVAELHLIKPLAARYGATPMVTARTVIGGGLYLLVAAPTLVVQPWGALGAWTWTAIIAGGIVGVGMGQWVKVRALRYIGPTQVVIYGNLVPLATLLIAWLTIGERSTWLEVGAGLLIVLGAILLQIGGRPLDRALEVPQG